jgi:outer membrane biosynthesis protein TonB
MKLKRSTQGLLIAALILGAGVAVYEGTIAPERQAQQEQSDRLFEFATTDVQRVTIETSDQVLQFDRLETPIEVPSDQEGEFTTTDWQFVRLDPAGQADDLSESMGSPGDTEATSDDTTSEPENSESENSEPENSEPENSEPENSEPENSEPENSEPENPEPENPEPENPEPENSEPENSEPKDKNRVNTAETTADEPTPARQAYIDFLFSAIGGASSDRSISAPANRRTEYGLDTPTLHLTIELKDGTRHTLDIGSRDFTQSFVYALLDTPDDATQLDVLLLPPDFINAFDRDLAAWDATIPIESDLELPEPVIEGEASPEADDINSEILQDPTYDLAPDRDQPLTTEAEAESGLEGFDLPETPNETSD